MKTFLGIFLFSLLLTTGTALQCETCIGTESCSGTHETCLGGLDACVTITTRITVGGVAGLSVVKSCYPKERCPSRPHTTLSLDNSEVTIECTNAAAVSMVSIFLSLSGLLLMILLL